MEKNKALGYHAVVTKPVKPSSLLNALLALLAPENHSDMDDSFVALPQHTRQWSAVKILVRLAALQMSELLQVVEDNVVNQKVTVKMLEKLGYRCDVAGNVRNFSRRKKKRKKETIRLLMFLFRVWRQLKQPR